MIFTLAIVATVAGTALTPPERRFVTRDLCEAARAGTVEDLRNFGAIVLVARCDLRELK